MKKCKYCGEINEDGSVYCIRCARELSIREKAVPTENQKSETSPTQSSPEIKKYLVFENPFAFFTCVFLSFAVLLFCIWLMLQPSSEEKPTMTEAEAESTAPFSVDSSTEEDYNANLNPAEYIYYDSGIDDFYFYYPAALYNDLVYSEERIETNYGVRILGFDFFGDAGSALSYALYERVEEQGNEEALAYLVQSETGWIRDAAVLMNDSESGRVVVTGYDDADRIVYELFRVTSEYLMQMKVVSAFHGDDAIRAESGYVTECLYRLCGFSEDDRGVRSYDEYIQGL